LQGGGKTQNLKVKCRLRERETDNQKNAKVQTKVLRLRLDAGLSSCDEDTKLFDYQEKEGEHFLASCTSINSQEQHWYSDVSHSGMPLMVMLFTVLLSEEDYYCI